MKMVNLKYLRFGRLIVIGPHQKTKWGIKWCCLCDCDKRAWVRSTHLVAGKILSCGCLSRDRLACGVNLSKHGMKYSPEHRACMRMRGRCLDHKNNQFHNYGGRGIKICDRWMEFKNFFADMGKKPSPKHSLDRVNNDEGYCPSNCRWADPITQACNRRTSRYISWHGEKLTFSQWDRRRVFPKGTVQRRKYRGFSDEKTLLTPV